MPSDLDDGVGCVLRGRGGPAVMAIMLSACCMLDSVPSVSLVIAFPFPGLLVLVLVRAALAAREARAWPVQLSNW